MSDGEGRSGAETAFIERLADARLVHLDARILALHLLGDADVAGRSRAVMRALRDGVVRGQTSSLTLYQVLAEVYRAGEADLAREIARTLQVHEGLELVSADPEIAIQAAQVRAQLGGRPERAIQIATALAAGADVYLTSASGLRRIVGMTVVNLEDEVPPA